MTTENTHRNTSARVCASNFGLDPWKIFESMTKEQQHDEHPFKQCGMWIHLGFECKLIKLQNVLVPRSNSDGYYFSY